MYDAPDPTAPKPPPAPPCGVCGQPSAASFFDTRLCGPCGDLWDFEAPMLQALELAHADAHPEDVEQRGEYQFLDAARIEHRWVLLKRGVTERVATAAAHAWLRQQRAKARAA